MRFALKLAPYAFVRPGELRQCAWTEIDWDKRPTAEWLEAYGGQVDEVTVTAPEAQFTLSAFDG